MIEANTKIKDALTSILMRDYEFAHKERSQIVLSVLELLNYKKMSVFYTLEPFPILDIGNFQLNHKLIKNEEISLSGEYLFASLRQGISVLRYKMQPFKRFMARLLGKKL